MVSKKILKMGPQKNTNWKNIGNKRRDRFNKYRHFRSKLELSLVYDKSDKHTTIYDSYNVEQVAKEIKSVKLSNFTEITS